MRVLTGTLLPSNVFINPRVDHFNFLFIVPVTSPRILSQPSCSSVGILFRTSEILQQWYPINQYKREILAVEYLNTPLMVAFPMGFINSIHKFDGLRSREPHWTPGYFAINFTQTTTKNSERPDCEEPTWMVPMLILGGQIWAVWLVKIS